MKNFKDVEELVSYMYDVVTDECSVTAIVGKDMAIDIMQEFLSYDKTNLISVELDTYGYDKEYQVVLKYDAYDEKYDFYINYAYDYEEEKYYGIDDIVLFHEDVNSRALIDMQSNKYVTMLKHDWFTFDDDVDEYEDDEEYDENTELVENEDNDNQYFVNGEQVTKEEYTEAYDFVQKPFKRVVLDYCEFMDEMNKWRRLLRW